jgi:predicted nucleotidyltransferase
MNRDEVFKILRDSQGRLREEFGVKTLSLYGSVARGEATTSSDVDLLVEFDRPAGYFEIERLQMHLENLLGCRVDLNTFKGLRRTIREQVGREAIRVG